MSRAARLLVLMQALRRHRRPVTAAALASALGVTVRTIYRDIATLQAEGATIEGAAGVGYLLRPGSFLPPLRFDEDEIDALVLGLRLAAARGDAALAEGARNALAKIEAVLPEAGADLRGTTGLIAAPPRERPHLAVLRAAMATERKVRLAYRDKRGAASARLIWPVAVGFFEDAEVTAAWCELRGAFRHFRLDRIVDAALTGERYGRRHRLLLADWRAQEALDELF